MTGAKLREKWRIIFNKALNDIRAKNLELGNDKSKINIAFDQDEIYEMGEILFPQDYGTDDIRIVSTEFDDCKHKGGRETLESYGEVLKEYNPKITVNNILKISISSLYDLFKLESDLESYHKKNNRDYWGLMIVTDDDGEQYLLIKDEYD